MRRHCSDAQALRLDEAGVRENFDPFLHGAHFQRHVDRPRVTDAQQDSGLFERTEPGQLRNQLVWSQWQAGQGVFAAFISNDRPCKSCIGLSHAHFDTWNRSAGIVRYRT